MGISLFMNFQVAKRLFSLFSKQPPTSRTGGKPTASRRMKIQAHYFQPHPLGMTFGMPSRSSTTLSKANIFHTLRTQLGIKDSELHLVLKYRGCLHRYVQEEMEFLDISSLGIAYRYAVKIEQKFKQKKRDFGSANPKPKGQNQGGGTQDNPSKPQENNNTTKPKKDT